jgi:hypothetical protein
MKSPRRALPDLAAIVRARLLLVAIVAAATTATCSSDNLEGTVPIPTNPESEFIHAAGLDGFLKGGVFAGEQCLWLQVADGGPAALVTIVWPSGYRARFDPPRLIGPDGRVIAWEGQEIRLAGSAVLDPPPDHCAISKSGFSAGSVMLAT